jgi:hypothetical protein
MQEIQDILGNRDEKKIRYATWAVRDHGGVGIKHHSTVVIKYAPSGTITLDTQGWHTPTTKERLNNWLPRNWGVYQENHVWYLWHRGEAEYRFKPGPENKQTWTFEDGMQILADGKVIGAGDAEERKALIKAAKRYVKKFTEALMAGKVGPPSGDCFYCCMTTDDGRTLGEVTGDSHILSHIEEDYFVPSLLIRAVQTGPSSQMAKWLTQELMETGGQPEEIWAMDLLKRQISTCLRKYVFRQLGLAT